MKKLCAIKDGQGNIIITEDSFEMILACLDNQKFVNEVPPCGDAMAMSKKKYNKIHKEIQKAIDNYNKQARKILHQKYIFFTKDEGGYLLAKIYEYQDNISPWSSKDAEIVKELFNNTIRKEEEGEYENMLPLDGNESIIEGTTPIGKTKDGYIICKSEPQPYLIERVMNDEYDYLTISEDGHYNRPWKEEEIELIKNKFNNI